MNIIDQATITIEITRGDWKFDKRFDYRKDPFSERYYKDFVKMVNDAMAVLQKIKEQSEKDRK